ncbi:MAG: hypothetical protein J1G06_05645 [Oscillospiraceae bacterium]|nr:hypothetical protein [Oscillospiraceae bacterium]
MPEVDFLGEKINLSEEKEYKPLDQFAQPFDSERFYKILDDMEPGERAKRIFRMIKQDPYREEYYFYAIDRDLPGIENIGIVADHYVINISKKLNLLYFIKMLREASQFVEAGEELNEATVISLDALNRLFDKFSVQAIPTRREKFIMLPETEVKRLYTKYKTEGDRNKLQYNEACEFLNEFRTLMCTFKGIRYRTSLEASESSRQYAELEKMAAAPDKNDRIALISAKKEIDDHTSYYPEHVKYFSNQLSESIQRIENEKLNQICEAARGKRLDRILDAVTEIEALDYNERLKEIYFRRLREMEGRTAVDTYVYLIKKFDGNDIADIYDELLWLMKKAGSQDTVREYISRKLMELSGAYQRVTGLPMNVSSNEPEDEGRIDYKSLCRKCNSMTYAELESIADHNDEALIKAPMGIKNPRAYTMFAKATVKIAYATINYPKVEARCKSADTISLEELKKLRTLINDEEEYSGLRNSYSYALAFNISKHVSVQVEKEFERTAGMSAAALTVFRLEIDPMMNNLIAETRSGFEKRFSKLMADAETKELESLCVNFESMTIAELKSLGNYISKEIRTKEVAGNYTIKVNERIRQLENEEMQIYISGIDIMDADGKISLLRGLNSPPYSEMTPDIINNFRRIIYDKIIADKVKKYYNICLAVAQSGLYGTVRTGFDGSGNMDQNILNLCNNFVRFDEFEIPLVVYAHNYNRNGIVITDKNIYVNVKGQVTKVALSDGPVINVTYGLITAELWLCLGQNYMQIPCRPSKMEGESIRNILNMSINNINNINNG